MKNLRPLYIAVLLLFSFLLYGRINDAVHAAHHIGKGEELHLCYSNNAKQSDREISSEMIPEKEESKDSEDTEDDDNNDEGFRFTEILNYELLKSETVPSRFCFSSSQRSSFTRRFIPYYILFHSWRNYEK